MNTLLLCTLACLALAAPPQEEAVYPDQAFSRPSVDRLRTFENGIGVSCQPQLAEAPAELIDNSITLHENSGTTVSRWTFKRNKGATVQPRLWIAENIRQIPLSLSFRVKNHSPRPIALTILWDEMPWHAGKEARTQTWDLGGPHSIEAGHETVLNLPLAGARPVRSEEKRTTPVCPLSAIAIQSNGVEDEVAYDLELGALTIEYPTPSFAVREWTVPSAAEIGKSCRLGWSLTEDVEGQALSLEFRRNDWVLWRVPLSSTASSADVVPPWYLAGETLTVGLVADGYRVPDTAPPPMAVTGPVSHEFARAERRERFGLPGVFVNGKPFSWNGYASYDYQPGNVADFGQSGINVFCVPTCAGRHIHHPVSAPTWCGPDDWDFGQIDERVGFSLQTNPDGMIMLRVSLALPPFWVQRQGAKAQALVGTPQGPRPWQETGCPAVPIALEEWRATQRDALIRLLRYCKSRPWAPRLMGLWLTGEVTEEWFSWACNNSLYGDSSDANASAFREWLGMHRLGHRGVPSTEVRKRPGWDLYPPTSDGTWAAAYAQFNSDLNAETIEYFAKAAKEETQGRLLVGAFYGYVLQLAGEPRQHTSGHFALRRLLDSPDVDMFGGIPFFEGRLLQDGYATNVTATQSIQAAKKLYMNENDLFSFRHPLIWYTEYDPNDPVGGAISMHQREFASDVVHGLQRQWFGLMASWHHDTDLQRAFASMTTLNKELRTTDHHGVEEVAFVVDDTSFAWTPPETMVLQAAHKMLLLATAKTGAPVSVWLLSDIDRLPDRIKCVVVANASAAKPEDIEKLAKQLAKGRRTYLVVGPAGLVNPETQRWDGSATARLTGLPVAVSDEVGPCAMRQREGGAAFSSLATLRPRATLPTEGSLVYGDGAAASGERSLARGGRLVWCGAPPVDIHWMRQLLEAAGVHCYAPEGYSVHASRDLISVTATKGGDITLHWKKQIEATDLLNSWSASGKEMSCPFAPGQTRLFRVEGRGR